MSHMGFISRVYPELPTELSIYDSKSERELYMKVYDKLEQLINSGNPMPSYIEFGKIIYNEIDKKASNNFFSWYSYSDWVIKHAKDVNQELKEIKEFTGNNVDPQTAIIRFYDSK